MITGELCPFYNSNNGQCDIRKKIGELFPNPNSQSPNLTLALNHIVETPPTQAKVDGGVWKCYRGKSENINFQHLMAQQALCNRRGTYSALQETIASESQE